jgi:hypothetical protein
LIELRCSGGRPKGPMQRGSTGRADAAGVDRKCKGAAAIPLLEPSAASSPFMVFSALEQVNKFCPFTETLYSSW